MRRDDGSSLPEREEEGEEPNGVPDPWLEKVRGFWGWTRTDGFLC